MRILFTGGGTGGHFYPIIAIAEEINEISKNNRLLQPELFYMSTSMYDENLLFENNISFEKISAGKIRLQRSASNIVLNLMGVLSTFLGVMTAIWRLFVIYPDVVFGKGAYVSFPALFAARLLRIPVVIHESDTIPGKVNKWAGKFAKRIAISYPESIEYFDKHKTAYTGCPIRKEVQEALSTGSHEYFEFRPEIKTIFVIGGSQGSRFINEVILNTLPELIKKYQVVHQVGESNIDVVEKTRNVVIPDTDPNKNRYKPYPYLNIVNLRRAAGVSDLIISRGGSTIFEIALWGRPSIIVPIPEETSHDQRSNAYEYARTGAAIVIEERNLAPGVLLSEIDRILSNESEKERMKQAALAFGKKDAAKLIAEEIIAIALEHEK